MVALASVAAEWEAERQRDAWRQAAFIGWQVYLTTPLEKGRRHMDFSRWLAAFGLQEQQKAERDPRALEREKQRAAENVARAIDAFRKGRIQRVSG